MRVFIVKGLNPIECKADGSLYRMSSRQKQSAMRLIKKLCSYYDKGNCMYLDKGEEVPCPQSICCKFFRNVILEDNEGKKLKAKIFKGKAFKHCCRCGRAFYSASNRAKYCTDCKAFAHRQQKAAYARAKRADCRKIGPEKS